MKTTGRMSVPSISRPSTAVVGPHDGDSGPHRTHSKGIRRHRAPSYVTGFVLCFVWGLGGRTSVLVWLVGAMVTYIADLCGLQSTTLISALGTISFGGLTSLFYVVPRDASLWLIVLIPILLVYIALLASSAAVQFQFMWDLEPELLIFLYDLVYHGMPFFGTAIISWGVGCMWGEEWMSWALMLGLGTSWLSRTRYTDHQAVSKGNMASDRILMWSFAVAPGLLAVYISLYYFGDGFDISSLLLHFTMPWLILSPSSTWLGAFWSLLTLYSGSVEYNAFTWIFSISSLTLSLAVYLAAIISVLPSFGISKGRTILIQKCLMVISARCLGKAFGGFLWHDQLCLDIAVYCTMTYLLVGAANFWYWGGAVIVASLGWVLHFSNTITPPLARNSGWLHHDDITPSSRQFGSLIGNTWSSYDHHEPPATLEFSYPSFAISGVVLLGLGMFLPIAVTSRCRNAPSHTISMALVFIWASLLTAMEQFLLKSEKLGYSIGGGQVVVFYPLWCSILTTVIGLLCLWRMLRFMNIEFNIVVGHVDLKAVFVWIVTCILSAKTIMAAVHHSFFNDVENYEPPPPLWATLILLLCLSGPFTLRSIRGRMHGLEGALWLAVTALFLYLLKISNSIVLEAVCWKVLNIEVNADPVGCTIGVGGLLWGLYGVFLTNYHFPEYVRAHHFAGIILISSFCWLLFGPQRVPSTADACLGMLVMLGPLVVAAVGWARLKQWRSLIHVVAASSGFVLGILISSHVLNFGSKEHVTRVDRWLGLAHANGLAAAAVLFIESTSQMSTRNSSNRILVLCWIVLTLLLGPPSTVILLMKNITWETWQACTLLTLQTHVVVALVLQYNTEHLLRRKFQTSTQKLGQERQLYSQRPAGLSWRSTLANGSIVWSWALGTCLSFGRGSNSLSGAVGMGFAACVLFLLQGYSGLKKWAPPIVGVWISWTVTIFHWLASNLLRAQDKYNYANTVRDITAFEWVIQLILLVVLAPVLWIFTTFLWTGQKGGFGGFSRQVSLILACIACLPSLIGADSPSLQLMALTGLCGSIFQMKFQYKQSQKHLKMI